MKRKLLALIACAVMLLESPFAVYAAEEGDYGLGNRDVYEGIEDEVVEEVSEKEMVFMQQYEQCAEQLRQLSEEKPVLGCIYMCETYDIKSEPYVESQTVATVYSGTSVLIQDVAFKQDKLWYKVLFYIDEEELEGYVEQSHLAYSDEVFLQWEEQFLSDYVTDLSCEMIEGILEDGAVSADIAQFPQSYQYKLYLLKQAHPNWIFIKQNTGLDWSSTVDKEDATDSRGNAYNLIQSGGKWVRASRENIKIYMEPRNYLNEEGIFQFELLTYNATYHTQAAVQALLSNTFMAGGIPGDSRTYSQAFFTIGSSLGVSPFHLGSRVYQEQGNGSSGLISGTYPGYEGLYNYYNIGATGTGTTAIVNGLNYARNQGWTTRYASLEGGARMISKNYILRGQDTLYLQKFNLINPPTHQYMQNVMAAYTEGKKVRSGYQSANALNNRFVFKIPVYNNMSNRPADYIFTDVSPDAFYFEPVVWAVGRGITTGTSKETFSPNATCSRSQVVTFIWRANGSPAPRTQNSPFADVQNRDAYYYKPVMWAYENGITTGVSPTMFDVNGTVTRGQMVTFIYRNKKPTFSGGPNPFVDVKQGAYYYLPVIWASTNKITTGTSPTTFAPSAGCTRGQAVTFIYRAFK